MIYPGTCFILNSMTVIAVVQLVLNIRNFVGKFPRGWADKAVANISKMIMIRQYSRDKWEMYWKEKLGIKGYFNIQIEAVELP